MLWIHPLQQHRRRGGWGKWMCYRRRHVWQRGRWFPPPACWCWKCGWHLLFPIDLELKWMWSVSSFELVSVRTRELFICQESVGDDDEDVTFWVVRLWILLQSVLAWGVFSVTFDKNSKYSTSHLSCCLMSGLSLSLASHNQVAETTSLYFSFE